MGSAHQAAILRQGQNGHGSLAPAKAALLRAQGWRFLDMRECNSEADEVIIDPRVTKLRLL